MTDPAFRQTDRQTNGQMEQADGRTDRQTDGRTNGQMEQADGQTDKWMDRWTH